MGARDYGIDPGVTRSLAKEVAGIRAEGVDIAIVVGGGNFYRGLKEAADSGMDRATADYGGMLATLLNALALQDALEREGTDTRIMSALTVSEVAEPYIRRRAMRHLEKGRVVIFAAGTGNPYFTTDTAASLRAMEIDAEVVLKATKVNGVYDSDPNTNKSARRYKTISYSETLQKNLKVMDATAIALCMDNKKPIVIFDMTKPGNILRAVTSPQEIGTVVWMGETVFA